jgi:endo-1,4-beta-xylanase
MTQWRSLAAWCLCVIVVPGCAASRPEPRVASNGTTTIATDTRTETSAPTSTSTLPAATPSDVTIPPAPCDETCTLAQLATEKGLRIGAAVDTNLLQSNSAYAEAVYTHFNAVVPENAMKLAVIHPAADQWNWDAADYLVNFAETHNMSVKGTSLVWGQEFGDGLPQWLRDIADPEAFKQAMIDSIATQVGRYKGRIGGWDVVNEPLSYGAAELDRNVFFQRLGIDYIAIAFRAAHEADPAAKLWLNDAFTEYYPQRADALFALAKWLVDAGVPITGVGLQTHLLVNSAVPAGGVGSLVSRLQGLGLEVELSEVDVPISAERSEDDQVSLYTQVVGECLDLGCRDIFVWGVSDGETWLDNPAMRDANVLMQQFSNPSNPLLLDRSYKPKPAYRALAALISKI